MRVLATLVSKTTFRTRPALLSLWRSAPLIDVTMDEIIRIFNTNVFATIRTAKTVIPHMASR